MGRDGTGREDCQVGWWIDWVGDVWAFIPKGCIACKCVEIVKGFERRGEKALSGYLVGQ